MALRGNAPEFNMMECGKHVRPKNVPAKPFYSSLGDRRKPSERYKRVLKRGEKRGDCICDYHDYGELRCERLGIPMPTNLFEDEDAGEEAGKATPAINPEASTKPFPFMKLPAELRLRVYEEASVIDEPIEFCPEPFLFTGTNIEWRTGEKEWLEDYRTSSKYHNNVRHEKTANAARLLRVSKQINKEATEVFYGGNEFRFSNRNGWIALDFWLYQIGLKNAEMLRKITVCHPDFLEVPHSVNACSSFNRGSLHGVYARPTHPHRHPGFTYDSRWFEDDITKDPALVLQKAAKLRELRLVQPLEVHEPIISNPIDATHFEKLTVTIVALSQENKNMRETKKGEKAVVEMAENHELATGEKWLAEFREVDENGCY